MVAAMSPVVGEFGMETEEIVGLSYEKSRCPAPPCSATVAAMSCEW